jgi:hypothetical protein
MIILLYLRVGIKSILFLARLLLNFSNSHFDFMRNVIKKSRKLTSNKLFIINQPNIPQAALISVPIEGNTSHGIC